LGVGNSFFSGAATSSKQQNFLKIPPLPPFKRLICIIVFYKCLLVRFALCFYYFSNACRLSITYTTCTIHVNMSWQSVTTIYVDVVLCGHCWCTVTTAVWSPQRRNFSQFNFSYFVLTLDMLFGVPNST
jgi:hypothetical protein